MTLLAIRSLINRICGMLVIIGIPCLIIGIILIIKNRSKTSKTRGIILVCLIPASMVIRLISSILFWTLGTNSHENQSYQGVHTVQQNIDWNDQNGGRVVSSETNY